MSAQAFTPIGVTQNISASTTSASADMGVLYKDVILHCVNASTAIAYVFPSATASPTATASNGVAIPPNGSFDFRAANCRYVAALLSTGTGTVSVQPGEGL